MRIKFFYLFPSRPVRNSDASPIPLRFAIGPISWVAFSAAKRPERLWVSRCLSIAEETRRRPCPFWCCLASCFLRSLPLPISHDRPPDSPDLLLWHPPISLLLWLRHPFRVYPDRTDERRKMKIVNKQIFQEMSVDFFIYIEHGFDWDRWCFPNSCADRLTDSWWCCSWRNSRRWGILWFHGKVRRRGSNQTGSFSFARFAGRLRSGFQRIHKQRTVLQQRYWDEEEDVSYH